MRGVLVWTPRRRMRRVGWAGCVTEQPGKKPQSCRLRTLCEHLPQLFRHVLDQVRSAVKLSWSRLKEFDLPDVIALGGDEGLMRVDGGIEVRLSWWHHPDDSAEHGHVWTHQQAMSTRPVISLPSKPMTSPSSANGAANASALR